jgi:prefoldin alpha subunit
MDQQQYFMRMQMLGQEAEKIEQQIQTIDQQIAELASVMESIQAIKDGKQKEILANLGKGIFVRAEIKDTELLVNVGKEVIVKKTADDTIAVIENQTNKLMAGKEGLIGKISQMQADMQDLLLEAQKADGHSHEQSSCCGHDDCKCEEPCEDCTCDHEKKK